MADNGAGPGGLPRRAKMLANNQSWQAVGHSMIGALVADNGVGPSVRRADALVVVACHSINVQLAQKGRHQIHDCGGTRHYYVVQ